MERFSREIRELIAGLQQEIEDADEAWYAHRLHCVVLILQGMSAREVAGFFGDPPRSVQRWFERFISHGLAGLADFEKSGRPRRLSNKQILEIDAFLRNTPSDLGLSGNLWDGKTLAAFIGEHYGVKMSVRQCQRLFHEYGFRLRKPRPEVGGADLDQQKAYKKTSNSPRQSRN